MGFTAISVGETRQGMTTIRALLLWKPHLYVGCNQTNDNQNYSEFWRFMIYVFMVNGIVARCILKWLLELMQCGNTGILKSSNCIKIS